MSQIDVQAIVVQLQTALGTQIVAGTIVLNLNEGRLASVKTETYKRIDTDKPLTNR